jgi:hypothetical protein
MVNFCAVCGCCTRTDIVREQLEDTLRICDVSAMGLFFMCVLISFLTVFILTHPVNFPCGRKPRSTRTKPVTFDRALTDSFHMSP